MDINELNRPVLGNAKQTRSFPLAVAGQGGVKVAGTAAQCAGDIEFRCPLHGTSMELVVYVTTGETQLFLFDTYLHQVTQRLALTESGVNADPHCQYWLSIDAIHQRISTGVGEVRKETETLSYCFEGESCEQELRHVLQRIGEIEVGFYHGEFVGSSFKYPVTVPFPLAVVPFDRLTMNNVADVVSDLEGEQVTVTVVNNLPASCQQLYANVAGPAFQLDTAEFPDFAQAINHSINTPGCWCYESLAEKARRDEFGGDDKNETYLRITLGENYGNSPGVPFVMEIWPSGHYSPIHNHADANAIIRVLSGAITVRLYPMLSVSQENQHPIREVTFTQHQVTWLSPGINQVHQLHNQSSDKACITIQCYQYAEGDNRHYEYFDFVNKQEGSIEQFYPDSDANFIQFKAIVKEEWEQYKATQVDDSAVDVTY